MAFMTATVSSTKELFLISDDLEEAIFCKYNSIPTLPVGEYDVNDPPEDQDLAEALDQTFKALPRMNSFEIVEKFWGDLDAPGYMDRTEYVLGDTQAEVAEQLLDMHYDRPADELDQDEKEDVRFLATFLEDKKAVYWLEGLEDEEEES